MGLGFGFVSLKGVDWGKWQNTRMPKGSRHTQGQAIEESGE